MVVLWGNNDDDWTHEDNMGKGLAGMIDDFNKSFGSAKVLPEVMCEKCLGTSLTFLDLLIFPRIIHKTLEVNRKLPEILIDTSKINQIQTIQHRRGRWYSTFPLLCSIQEFLNITESYHLWIHTGSYQ